MLRRRVALPPAGVMAAAAAAVPALVVATAAQSPAGRRPLRREHVGLPGRLRAAPRRPGGAGGARARRLSDRGRPRCSGSGVPPDAAPAAALLARPGRINRFERVLVWCHWVWFMVPHASVAYVWFRAARSAIRRRPPGCTPCSTSARCSTGRSRPRRPGTRPATAGCSATAPTDPQVRRMMIEYGEQFWGDRWPAPLRCPRRKSACCHAVAALRHVADGRPPALRGRAGGRRGRLDLRGHARVWRSSTWASTTPPTCSAAPLLAELVRPRGPALGPAARADRRRPGGASAPGGGRLADDDARTSDQC